MFVVKKLFVSLIYLSGCGCCWNLPLPSYGQKPQSKIEDFGQRQFEPEILASHGMDELQRVVVKHQATARVGRCAVLPVAGHGTAQVAHVDTNLVLASCQDLYIHLAVSAVELQHLVACDREFALLGVVGAINLHDRILDEIAADLALFLLGASLADGHIFALDDIGIPTVAECLLYPAVLGEDQDARSELVEAVADVGMRVPIGGLKIIFHDLLRCLLSVAACWDGEQSGLLLNDDEILVLIDLLQHAGVERQEGMREVDDYLVARNQRLIELGCCLSVDLHVAVSQKCFDLGSGTGREGLKHERQ